jgi:cytochrome c-type biogenesis protein CcmF
MDFIGEHLLPGKLGHFFLLLSLVSSLGATVSYFLTVQKSRNADTLLQAQQWKRLARIFFITEVISVFAVFGILFYIISNHYFEYKYAWQHSSRALETKYLLSCFWEGQEGSFLLWSVWHCVLGLVFIWREKEWEAPVMAVVSFAQVLLATMIIGIPLFGSHIGSNPFSLMRNVFDLKAQIPMLTVGDNYKNYLSYVKDGNGLNILLQNYWMVIHPPVLFLGFASTVIPFGFAVGGLWTKKFTEWTKHALPWALFSGGIFGLGIMMGAAWAYESLNFGGYWAWDPVENASLVPWLVLVAGIHGMLIYRHTGNALRTTYLFLLLCFVLVLYSTYLTRSGDLQETSVHAFTGEGITRWHLRIFLLLFGIPAFVLLAKRYKSIPFIAKEEETSSREFWMFVGSLVLFLSALLIIAMTSIPIFNKIGSLFTSKGELFKPLATSEESEYAYNRIQIFVAIILGAFTGFGMYLKYKKTGGAFLKRLILPGLIGLIAAGLILAFGEVNYRDKGLGYMAAVWVAVVAAVFSVITNAAYIWIGVKSLKRAGGAIAHVGFALMLTGILISSSKKEVLSYNTSGIPVFFGKDSKEKPGENLTLVKGVRTDMGKYWVTYAKDSTDPVKPTLWYFPLNFESKDGKEKFTLLPEAYINHNQQMGLSANPDAKHYWNYDLFTYITSLPDPNRKEDTTSFKPVTLSIGDTLFYSSGFGILEDVKTMNHIPGMNPDDSASVATIKVRAKTSSIYTLKPILIGNAGGLFAQPDTLLAENLIIQLQKTEGKKVELGIKETDAVLSYVTLKAYKFPFINVLWGGTVIMVLGFFISMLRRIETKRTAGSPSRNRAKTLVDEMSS